MAHGATLNIDIKEVLKAKPITFNSSITGFFWALTGIGFISLMLALLIADPAHVWGVYYVNILFWMGLACGGVIIAAIFQIVRAKWSPPVRRIAESSSAFLPYAYLLWLATYFGKEHLFVWARQPMPGREWWMQPDFVYARFAVLLLILFILMRRYVRLSLRGDIGLLREQHKNSWTGSVYQGLITGWQGANTEIKPLQVKMSCSAPVLIMVYAVVYSLFSFEMVMGMDTIWFSNMFGGFFFVGNVYIAWALLAVLTITFANLNKDYAKIVSTNQLWDLGKLVFGFSILWAYLAFSQYLPQWYGNMPEETQWLLLRVRGLWMPLMYTVLGLAFIIPFLTLLSEDVKRTPWAFSIACFSGLIGVWLEKYLIIMPQLMPDYVPLYNFPWLELSMTAGFAGIYGLAVISFMRKFPFVPVSHPLTAGNIDW